MRRAASGTFIVLLATGGTLGTACGDTKNNDDDDLYTPTLTGGSSSKGNSSTGNKGSTDDDDDTATGGKKGTGGGGNTTDATGGTSTVSWKGCDGKVIPPEDAEKNTCQEEYYETEPMPVDLVIMMDRSISLAEEVPELGLTRWEGMVQAMETFVNNPDALRKDVRVSLQFFNQTGGHVEQTDCDVARYLTPRIPMDSLADNGQAIVEAMAETKPAGQTPTAPALQGALMYARQWNAQSGGRATAVLLVSDGLPTRCQDPISVAKLAELTEAYANPPLPDDGGDPPPAIPTFVLGLGPATHNLDQIAYGGGTEEAYAVDLDADAADAFAEVLSKITNAQLSCDFIIPEKLTDPSMHINYDKNRIWYTPPDGGDTQQIPRVANANACKGGTYGGWYYQYPESDGDNSVPSLITVCPCTCALFRTGLIDIQWGCSPMAL
jgi:hypothetical protein